MLFLKPREILIQRSISKNISLVKNTKNQQHGVKFLNISSFRYIIAGLYFCLMNYLSLYNNPKQAMQESPNRKYSKVSAALKCYFLRNMYYHRLSIKQASRRCKINYSTAKILLRDLTPKERSFIKVLIRQKEEQEEMKENFSRECGHVIIDSPSEHESPISNKIEVVSRVAFDFFNLSQQ